MYIQLCKDFVKFPINIIHYLTPEMKMETKIIKILVFIIIFLVTLRQIAIYVLWKNSEIQFPRFRDPFCCKRMQTFHLHAPELKQFDLRIIVIVYNRSKSVLRLLKSLNEAVYDGDNIKLEVWIDISAQGKLDRLTFLTANNFSFKHGLYEVITHRRHVGIYGQWLSTWKPQRNSSEIAAIFEDDITVSRFFYRYLKIVHLKYDRILEVNGYALQGISIKHSEKDTTPLLGPNGSLVFLYPFFGTWGFSPCTTNWIAFLEWYRTICKDEQFQPYIPGNIATKWYKIFQQQGKADSMWGIWHMYYAWINKEYTLHSNLPDTIGQTSNQLHTNIPGHVGFASNWQEKGLHYKTTQGMSNRLLKVWKPELHNLPTYPQHVDISGKVISTEFKVDE